MTRINGISGGIVAGKPKPTASTGGAPGNFNVTDDSQAAPAQASQAAPGVMLSNMLALQEVESETIRDKTARRHGLALLQALSDLQQGLLSDLGDSEAGITALNRLATQMPEAADPGLTEILDAVRLRAKIELLRRGFEIS